MEDNGARSYRRYLEGDEAGLVDIIREYRTGLTLYLYGFVGDFRTAEELTEDTFVKLGIRKPRDKGTSSFKTWLYTVGRHVALDYLRRNRHTTVPLEDAPPLPGGTDPEAVYLQKERDRLLHRALDGLCPSYRQVLWLRYFENLSHREIAAILHKRVHTVEVLVSRAKTALKDQLHKEGFDYEKFR